MQLDECIKIREQEILSLGRNVLELFACPCIQTNRTIFIKSLKEPLHMMDMQNS